MRRDTKRRSPVIWLVLSMQLFAVSQEGMLAATGTAARNGGASSLPARSGARPGGSKAGAPARSGARPGGSKAALPAESILSPGAQGRLPDSLKGDKWAVVIGVSRFADSRIPPLKYSGKDARDFYNYLIDPALGRFQKDHVKLLIDEDATKVNIMDVLGDSFLPHAAAPGDLVVIYLSTHGSPSGADIRGVNYVMANDSRVNKLFATGIEMRQLVRTVKERVHTNRVVLVLDTCYSGAGAEEAHKGIFRKNVDTQSLAQSSGTLVISSSAPDQRAFESDSLKNSYFTSYLIEALSDRYGKVSLDQAFNSMRERVQSSVLRDKGVLQTPVISGSSDAKRLVVGLPPSIKREAPITVAYSETVDAGSQGAGNDGSASDGSRAADGRAPVDLSDYGVHMRNAFKFRQSHKLWDAIHELQLAQRMNPTSIEAFVQASDIFDEQGRFFESLEAAKKAVINADSSSEARYRLGRASLRTGAKEEALRQIRTAISLDPENSMAYNWLGFVNEHELFKSDEAQQNYRKAVELDPLNVRALVNLGLSLERQAQVDEAEKLFKKALEADSDDWEAQLSLGCLHFYRKNQPAEGIKALRNAVRLDPANARLHSELAQMLANQPDKLAEAESEFKKGIELAPKSGIAHMVYAEFLAARTDRFEEAEKEFRTAILLNDRLDGARVGLADLLVSRRKIYDQSYDQYKQALKINPKNARAYVGLAVIQVELYKNNLEAEKELRKALAIDPGYSHAHDLLGVVLSRLLDRHAEAKKAFEAALAADAKNADAEYHYAQLLMKQNAGPDEIRKRLARAITIAPQNSAYKTALARLLSEKFKDRKAAEQLYRQAIESNIGDSEAHFRLGMLLIEHLGRRKEGETELTTASKQDPANHEIKAAVERFVR